MDGEVGAALFDDDGLCRVEEPLHSLSRPQFSGLYGAFDCALLPRRFLAGAGHRHLGATPIRENMDELYRSSLGHRCPRPPRGNRVRDWNFLMTRIVFSSAS